MTCINCQSRIWNVLKLRPEITGITVSYEYSRAEFDYDPKKIRMKEIVKMIEDLGYQVIPAEQFRRKQLRQAAAEIFAIALLFVILQRFGILNHHWPDHFCTLHCHVRRDQSFSDLAEARSERRGNIKVNVSEYIFL